MPIQTVDYNTGRCLWTCASLTGGAPTEIRLKAGTVSGAYTLVKTYPYALTGQAPVKDLVPAPGTYYAVGVAWNKYGEVVSPEVPFECGVAPGGTIGFSIG